MTIDINTQELLELVERSPASTELSVVERDEIKSFLVAPSDSGLAAEATQDKSVEALTTEAAEQSDIRILLASLGLPGRIKYALFGNSICRALLIRDSNKMVQQFVMKNPKLTLKEVEEFSKNQHLSEFVLRSIADSKMWMKSGVVKYNLVTNAKTPQDIALKWLRYLQSHEIKRIAKSKNIPQLIATTAKKLSIDLH